jgi:hypothetical protein
MALDDALSGEPRNWPPTEYYQVRRPMKEWVPPLEVLKEMERDGPYRFRKDCNTHERRCMDLYQEGKSREEVFREVSCQMSKRGIGEIESQKEVDRRKRQWGLFPSLKEHEAYQKQSAGGFQVLKGTSQGSRFDVPPKKWIEEELIAVGARSKLTSGCRISFHK